MLLVGKPSISMGHFPWIQDGYGDLIDIPGLVNIQKIIEHGPVEIVDLPSYKMVIFHSYVSLPEGNDSYQWFIMVNK